jgi:hypothetical protein
MALIPSASYPGQTATSDAGYPQGKAQNILVAGDGTGTPWEADLANDLFGMQQALLDESFITPTGNPDEVGASQYLDAIEALADRSLTKLALSNSVARTPASAYVGTFTGGAYVLNAIAGTRTFVLVGSAAEIQTSLDGITWTHRTPGGGFAGDFFNIARSTSLFVAVGDGAIQTSPDGTTWTARTPDGGFTDNFYGVAFGAGVYVIVGENGEIQSSTNGTAWTQRTPDASFADDFYGVAFGAGVFVIVGQNGEIQTSPDGVTWTHQDADGAPTVGFTGGVTFGNGAFVAGGFGASALLQTSPDGVTWTARTVDASVIAAAGGPISVGFWRGKLLVLISRNDLAVSRPRAR